MASVFGVELGDIPETDTPVEAIVILKVITEDDTGIVFRYSPDLSDWEALGMLIAAGDILRVLLKQGFEEAR